MRAAGALAAILWPVSWVTWYHVMTFVNGIPHVGYDPNTVETVPVDIMEVGVPNPLHGKQVVISDDEDVPAQRGGVCEAAPKVNEGAECLADAKAPESVVVFARPAPAEPDTSAVPVAEEKAPLHQNPQAQDLEAVDKANAADFDVLNYKALFQLLTHACVMLLHVRWPVYMYEGIPT